jgi:hypothetical protein
MSNNENPNVRKRSTPQECCDESELEKKKGCTAQKEMSLVEQRDAPALAVHTVILFEGHRDPVSNNDQERVSPLSAIRSAIR